MTDTEFAALLRSKRTTTEQQAHANERKHDSEHLSARERGAAYGS
jgi:hypothetical protein